MDNTKVLTIWKDGTHKVWQVMDAEYAKADPDYLLSIGMGDLEKCTKTRISLAR